jgi:alkanesulfonate monooxygenase SsuD/methylene tetrahydromethanopterin reductase-like flavin-dependent oxidoreductase (luciferase family)
MIFHARIADVRIGMTMPVMEPNLDAATLKAWARVIDGGPFSSLCWGERIAFDNPDSLTLLGALAAWTDRVRLVTTVIVPQLHDPVMLAKGLATGDMLSGGRLTVGVGVGGRREDYHAVRADPATQTMRGLADSVAVMKRIWAGRSSTRWRRVCPVAANMFHVTNREWYPGRSRFHATISAGLMRMMSVLKPDVRG